MRCKGMFNMKKHISELKLVPMRMTGRTPAELSRLSGTMTVSPMVTGWG